MTTAIKAGRLRINLLSIIPFVILYILNPPYVMPVLLFSAAFGLPGTGLAVTAVLARILSLTSGSRPFPLAKQRGFITAAELFKSSGTK